MVAINSSNRRAVYNPVNSAGPFPIDFPLFSEDATDLRVRLSGLPLTGFTFSGTLDKGFYGAPNTWVGGSVMLAAPVTGELVIDGLRQPRRQIQYTEGRGIPARDHNTELNILTAVQQELRRDVDKALEPIEGLEEAVAASQAAADTAVAAADVAVEAADVAVEAAATLTSPVLYVAQSITTPQQNQALANLGVSDLSKAVLRATDAPTARGLLGMTGFAEAVGLTMENVPTSRATHFRLKAGEAFSDGTPKALLALATDLVKRIDQTFAAGANGGALDTGGIADGPYTLWLIKNSTSQAVDVLVARRGAAPVMPVGFDLKAPIRNFVRAAGQIQGFAPFPALLKANQPPKKTRSPLSAVEENAENVGRAPWQFGTNFYPHSVIAIPGAVFLSSVGGNGLGSGNAKVEKFDSITAALLSDYSFGPYPTYGASGLCYALGSIWVAVNTGNGASGAVYRLNADTLVLEATITTGSLCRDVWFDGANIWSLSGTNGQTYRINPATNAIDSTVATAGTPFRGGASDTHVYVACFAANTVRKIDKTTGTVVANIATSASPNWLDWDGRHMWVSCYDGDCVHYIDPTNDAISAAISTSGSSRPHGLRRVGEELWIACSGDHYIRIMNVNTLAFVRSIPVPANPPSLALAEDAIWVPSGNTNVMRRHVIKATW